jgi:hypothetical protein
VRVSYALAYPDGNRPQRAVLRLRRRGGGWRLLRVAGTTRLVVTPASQRSSVLGKVVPNRVVAMFPGAPPISFDTPYLQVSSRSTPIRLSTGAVTIVRPAVSRAGRLAASVWLQHVLGRCLSSGGTACPLPPGRVVPGSVRGHRVGALNAFRVRLVHSPLGIVSVEANVEVAARYRVLTFRNVAVNRHGRITLRLRTSGYVTAPLRLGWRAS